MTAKTGRGAGRPAKQPVQLSDAALFAVTLYFLKQVKDRASADPAIMYITSLQNFGNRC